MEYILDKGKEGKHQDDLISGQPYQIYLDGESLGVAKYCEDDLHGCVFLQDGEFEGLPCLNVCQADEWIMLPF